jgi:hypothetical protein
MSNSLNYPERLEGQLCHDLSLEMSSNKIKDGNHNDADDDVTLHGIEHHLLAGFF